MSEPSAARPAAASAALIVVVTFLIGAVVAVDGDAVDASFGARVALTPEAQALSRTPRRATPPGAQRLVVEAEAPHAAPAPRSPTADDTIEGRVVDLAGRGLAGVLVRCVVLGDEGRWTTIPWLDEEVVVDADLTRAAATTTDVDGRWRLPRPAPVDESPDTTSSFGDAHLLVFDAPTPELTRPIVNWTGEERVPDVVLGPGVSVSGRVVDEHLRPVAGARVWAMLDDTAHEHPTWSWICVDGHSATTTGDDGRFTIRGVVPGEVYLVADRAVVPELLDCGELAAGAVDVGDLFAPRGLSVRGRVVDTSGAPIAQAEVIVGERDDEALGDPTTHDVDADAVGHAVALDRRIGSTRTDADGRFEVAGLIERDVWLSASAPGFGVAPRALEVDGASAELVLPDVTHVALRIVDAIDGAPLDARDVELTAHTALRRAHADGRVEPGTPCRVTTDGARAVVELVSTLGARVHAAAPGRVATDAFVPSSADVVTIALEPLGVVAGTIEDGARARVELREPGGHARDEVLADERGRFRFRDVAPGRWHVVASTAGAGRAVLDVVLAPRESLVDLHLVPRASASLEVVLVHGDARPARGPVQAVHATTGLVARDVYPDHGDVFALRDLPPGRWTVAAEGTSAVDVVLAPGARSRVELERDAAPRVTGVVTLDGARVARGEVLRVQHGRVVDATPVRADGSFELVARDARRGRLAWRADDALWFAPRSPDLAWGRVTPFDLVVPARPLDVLVLDESGRPLAGVSVGADDEHLLGETDASGRLRLAALSPDVTRLEVGGADDVVATAADVGPTTREVVLRTRVGGTARLDVVDRVGEPVGAMPWVRFESVSDPHDRIERFGWRERVVPAGAWRVVAVPMWGALDDVPPGVGEVVHVRPGETARLTVPLTY